MLEVGVGSGKNNPYYPERSKVTAVNLSPQMLKRAARRVSKLGVSLDLARRRSDL